MKRLKTVYIVLTHNEDEEPYIECACSSKKLANTIALEISLDYDVVEVIEEEIRYD